MIKNYFKTAYRSLLRNKAYAAINVLGLALGISCCLIIFLIVKFELSYESIHSEKDRIFRITSQFQRGDEISYMPFTPFPMAKALRNDFPELLHVTQTYYNFQGLMINDENEKFRVDQVLFADHEYLNVFDFELLEGDKSTCLINPNTVVLTKSVAELIFGTDSPMGEILELNNALTLEVTGIVADPPENIHQPFEVLVSYESFNNEYYELEQPIEEWDLVDLGATYVMVSPNQSPSQLEEQLVGFSDKYNKGFTEKGKYELQSLNDIHFDVRYAVSNVGKTTERTTVLGFSAIGIVLLLAACINFINLSTAQSIKRAKEVGVRKVMGAFRGQLVYQFLGETLIIAGLAAIISIVLVEVLLPATNSILDLNLSLNLLGDGITLGFLTGLILIVTLFGGIYPALILSGFKPVKVLRSNFQSSTNKGLSIRRFLVIAQFLIAQVLIISTIVTYNQVEYFKNKSMGFEADQVINFGTGVLDSAKQELFKARLMENSGIERVAWFSSSPTNNGHLYGPYRFTHLDNPEGHRTTHRSIDANYVETFGLTLVAGSDIDNEIGKANPGILVNETLVRTAGITDISSAVGKRLEDNWLLPSSTIVGVVKDFHNQSLHREIIPTIFFYDTRYHWRAAIKLDGTQSNTAVVHLEETFNEMFPDGMLSYQFEDQRMADYYEAENKIFDAFQVFTIIAIVICCLGLFGLVSFIANQKIKEVGIRKVLGANLIHILTLFGNQFSKPILMAFLVAGPVGYYFMSDWLDNFVYSQEIGAGVFIATLLTSFMVAAITVSYHSLRAAHTNPIDSLRYE